ncbi:hypothetical protein FRC20_011492 [Serendipita sp. 405]|nr:hypothetical protein FRC16_010364 [Serendipita sp. 398]KAG8861257.1 hypothetical protein FRC20_011492 [Serendipita sp. 405]
MKFSTGLIGLALALNVHAAPKPSSSTVAKSTSTKPPATTSASPLVSSSQQATTTTCRPPSVAQYSQCGGMGYTGSTTCTAGGTCVYVNESRAHREVHQLARQPARQPARRRPVPPLLQCLQRPPHASHLQSYYGANAVGKVTPVLVLALREVNAFMSTNGTLNACIASSRPARGRKR